MNSPQCTGAAASLYRREQNALAATQRLRFPRLPLLQAMDAGLSKRVASPIG
jgi:hypothetical protein